MERFFFELGSKCPYGQPKNAIYRQAPLCSLPESLFRLFLDAGYRRNGNSLYCMTCPDCRQCVPIKLKPAEFQPNRNQKRVLKKNADLVVEAGQLTVSEEKIALLNRFLATRYPEKNSCAREYYAGFFLNAMTETMEFRYILDGHLMGLAVVDWGAEWINAVYFYFDPDFSKRSPGTFNILTLIDYARRYGMADLYLGYWIKDVAAMRYKDRFKPHYLLQDGNWKQVTAYRAN